MATTTDLVPVPAQDDIVLHDHPLLTLPHLVIKKIWSRLSFSEKKRMRLVSRHWGQAMQVMGLLKIRATVTSQTISEFLKCHLPCQIDSVIFQNLPTPMARICNNAHQIVSAQFGPKVCPENLKYFLKHGTSYLEKLIIPEFSLANLSSDFLSATNFAELAELTIFVAFAPGNVHVDACIALIKFAELPSINSFGLHIRHSTYSPTPRSRVYKLHAEFVEFLQRQKDALRRLQYTLKTLQSDRFTALKIPRSLTTSKLRQFELDIESPETCHEFLEFLASFQSPLNKLKLRISSDPWRVKEILERSGRALSVLDLEFPRGHDLDWEILRPCVNLKSLSILSPLSGNNVAGLVFRSMGSLRIFPGRDRPTYLTFLRQNGPFLKSLVVKGDFTPEDEHEHVLILLMNKNPVQNSTTGQ